MGYLEGSVGEVYVDFSVAEGFVFGGSGRWLNGFEFEGFNVWDGDFVAGHDAVEFSGGIEG